MLETTSPTTHSDDALREALDHLCEVVPSNGPISVSIDGRAAFEVRNAAARKRLAEALEWVIETEITQISIEQMRAGETIPLEQVQAELDRDEIPH